MNLRIIHTEGGLTTMDIAVFDGAVFLPCAVRHACYVLGMSFTSVYLAEETLALPPEQRETLAKLLTDSLVGDGRSDAEIKAMLRARLDDLKSGRDKGMTLEEVFGEALA
jgi:putative addiction module component (TIGR02574 family)